MSLLPTIVSAQLKSEAERLWERGDKAYKEKRYSEAIYYYDKSLAMCGRDDECLASNYNGLAAAYEDMGNEARALSYYEKAIESTRRIGNKNWLADNLFLAGAIYHRRAIDFEKAYVYLEEARRLFIETGNMESMPIIFFELGKAALTTGRYEKALASFRDSARLYEKKGEKNSVGANHYQMGLTFSQMGQLERALLHFEMGLKIARQHKDPEGVSNVLTQMAGVYQDLHNYDRAISCYHEALDIQKKNKLSKEMGLTMNNLGTLYMDLHRYEKALDSYQEALKIAKEHDDHPTVATLLNNIGDAYGKIGKIDRELKHYHQSLGLEKKHNRPHSLVYVLNNIGIAYAKAGQYDAALKYLREALEVDRKLNNPHLLATRLNNLGSIYLKQKKFREAEAVFLERKNMESRVKPNRLLHPGLVEIYLLTQRYDEALKLINETPPSPFDSPARHVEYYLQTGLAYKGKGFWKDAAVNMLKAVELMEDMRADISERTGFFAGGAYYYGRLAPYQELISMLYAMATQGHRLPEEFRNYGSDAPSAAFYFAELTKARTLLEAMAGTAGKVGAAELPAYLKAREEELIEELAQLNRRWEDALKRGEQVIKEWQTRQSGVKKQLTELINLLRRDYPRYAALHHPLPVKAEDLSLKENEVLLEYAVTEKAVCLFVVRKEGVKKFIKIPIGREVIEKSVKSFVEPMNSKRINEFSANSAQSLYRLLLMEALHEVKEGDEVIIVPDGILGVLPFEGLIIRKGSGLHDHVYVADRYAIRYYQSATILALNRLLRPSESEKPLFALGNPIYSSEDPRYGAWKEGKERPFPTATDQNQYAFRGLAVKAKWGAITDDDPRGKILFPPLPETEEEVKEIARIVGVKPEPPQVLLSAEANEANVKKAKLDRYRYIHFATHASLPGMVQGINEPFILLSQVENRDEDGFLTLSEVTRMQLNAELVVLSACVTGMGREVEGEGVVNFARAFQQAGAKSVVVSLWEVASEPTVEYMKMYYRHLREGKTKAEALRLTRTSMRAKYPNPFYWSVFILHGEG